MAPGHFGTNGTFLPYSGQTFEVRKNSLRDNPSSEYLFDCEIKHLSIPLLELTVNIP